MRAYNDPNFTTPGWGGNNKGHGRIYPLSSPPSSSSSPSPPFSIQGRGGDASSFSLTVTLTLVDRFYPNSASSRPETLLPKEIPLHSSDPVKFCFQSRRLYLSPLRSLSRLWIEQMTWRLRSRRRGKVSGWEVFLISLLFLFLDVRLFTRLFFGLFFD